MYFREQSYLKKLYKKAIQNVANIKEQIPILDYDYKTLQPTIKEKRAQVEQLEITIEAEKENEAEVRYLGLKSTNLIILEFWIT